MFRKYTKEENIKTIAPVRSSEQRTIRAAILQQYPGLEPYIDDIFPKKASLNVCKCADHVQIILDPNGNFIFFQNRQGPYIPTLRFLHQYPDILPKYTVDRGAVSFVLGGANIMAPGLTNTEKGCAMDDVPADTTVAVMVAGKQHAIAIGLTTMSTAEIIKVNKGNAVENTHWLNDGLWTLKAVSVADK